MSDQNPLGPDGPPEPESTERDHGASEPTAPGTLRPVVPAEGAGAAGTAERPDADAEQTLERLADYLDSGREPYDAGIEESPELMRTLRALERTRSLSAVLLREDALTLPEPAAGWLGAVLAEVHREARAGRDIPLSSSDPDLRLSITEGAVRALVREAGDEVPGVLVGRCRLEGEVTTPGARIAIEVTAAVTWGVPIADAARQVRERIRSRLLRQTELNVVSIDVRIEDVFLAPTTDVAAAVAPGETAEEAE